MTYLLADQANDPSWQYVLLEISKTAVTIVTILAGVAIAWINLRGRLLDNTRKTETALAATIGVADMTSKTAAVAAEKALTGQPSRLAMTELQDAKERLDTLLDRTTSAVTPPPPGMN